MPRRHAAPVLLAHASLVLATLAWPRPAAADCDPAGPVEEELRTAQVAFVGRVIDIDASVATFAVSEVWAGTLPGRVDVHGLIDDIVDQNSDVGPVVSEDDRVWSIGGDYLVLPIVDAGMLRDHICTATTEWQPELDELRPAKARILPIDSPAPDPGVSMPAILVGITAALVLAVSVLAFRRQSR